MAPSPPGSPSRASTSGARPSFRESSDLIKHPPSYHPYPEYQSVSSTYPSETPYGGRPSFVGPYSRFPPPSLGSLPPRGISASTLPTPPTPPTPSSYPPPAAYPFPKLQSLPQPSYPSPSHAYPTPLLRQYGEAPGNNLPSPGGMHSYYDSRPPLSNLGYFDQRPTYHDRERLPAFERGSPLPSPNYEARSPYSPSWQDSRGTTSPGEIDSRDGRNLHFIHRETRDLSRSASLEMGSGKERHSASLNIERDNTTPFISKLSHLLSHPEYTGFIRWSRDGTSFIFAHTSTELLEVFSRFFRHSNAHSFVRQLNIYGFTRLTTLDMIAAIDSAPYPSSRLTTGDYSAFTHPEFWRSTPDRPCPLGKLKPRVSKKKRGGDSEGLITRPPRNAGPSAHNSNSGSESG